MRNKKSIERHLRWKFLNFKFQQRQVKEFTATFKAQLQLQNRTIPNTILAPAVAKVNHRTLRNSQAVLCTVKKKM